MKESLIRSLIREAIEQIYESAIQYQVGDRVKIDSSYGGGIGTVELAKHPYYAIKFDQTGTTDSFHFSDLRPFDDEAEDEKDKNIDTGLDENAQNLDFEGMWKDLESWAIKNKYPSSRKQNAYTISIANQYGINLDINIWKQIFRQFEALFNKGYFGDWEHQNSWLENKIRSFLDKNSLKEGILNRIYHVEGVLLVDSKKRNQKDILSDIRSIVGVTIVRNIEMPQDATSNYFRSTIEVKIDPFPFVKQGNNDINAIIEEIKNNIKGVMGVIAFKDSGKTYSTND
jgi:hypothetical protein